MPTPTPTAMPTIPQTYQFTAYQTLNNIDVTTYNAAFTANSLAIQDTVANGVNGK